MAGYSILVSSCLVSSNRPRSIYQYSNTTPRLSGQTSIFGVVFFVFKSLLRIDQFRYTKIQPKTIDLSTRLWGITTDSVGFIPQNLVLRSIV